MEPDEFRQWRKSLGWKQKDAAERLGLKKRVIQYYEKGDRDGKAVAIPTSVELACLALALGHERWNGELAAQAIETRSAAAAVPDDAPLAAVAALDDATSSESASHDGHAFAEPERQDGEPRHSGGDGENANPSNGETPHA